MNSYYCFLWSILTVAMLGCVDQKEDEIKEVGLVVLGTVQDGGSPHIGCKKSCCEKLFSKQEYQRKVTALGIFDFIAQKKYLVEASPDIASQIYQLNKFSFKNDSSLVDGVFLTHAHIGHYTGLMYFGKEATNTKNTPVYAMPKMKIFLEQNGPWSQLVNTNNIKIKTLKNLESLDITKQLQITPFLVPHRDEYSETVGYYIKGPNKTALFIPDIDKWNRWETSITALVKEVDYAFLDATFYSGEELNNRTMSEIPHPFILESMKLFNPLNFNEKQKIYFIHMNHTNPALDNKSNAYKTILKNGFNIAEINSVFLL